MTRGLAGPLLVAVSTAASLLSGQLHGLADLPVVTCAATAAGLVAYVSAEKKNAIDVTQVSAVIT